MTENSDKKEIVPGIEVSVSKSPINLISIPVIVSNEDGLDRYYPLTSIRNIIQCGAGMSEYRKSAIIRQEQNSEIGQYLRQDGYWLVTFFETDQYALYDNDEFNKKIRPYLDIIK